MADIQDINELLKNATMAGGVDERSILKAEEALGIRFPPSYREFLSQFGAAFCTKLEISGLFNAGDDDDQSPLWSNVVTSTLQLRRASRGLIPNEYVPISDDGGDHTFYLDTSRCNAQDECPVIVLGPGADIVVVADDFFDFVSRSVKGCLSF
jgi:antitoxin YobK